MDICKYCGGRMLGEYETLSSGKHYRAYLSCPTCGAMCDCERKESGNQRITIKEKWYEPSTGHKTPNNE